MAIEIVFNILIGLGVLFYLVQAIQLPTTDNPADVLGAGGFPIVIGIIALIGLAMITLHTIKEKKKVDIPMLNLRSIDGRMVFINLLVLGAYIALLDVIGFVLMEDGEEAEYYYVEEDEEEAEEEEEDWHYHSMEERLNEVGMSMRDFF